jgi:outer membrane protein insertion porin family
LGLGWQSSALALEPFVIDEIKVEGLQRISVGTVFNYLPLEKGEQLDAEAASAAVRALFKTGFFEDVVLEREGDSLVVFVEERPAIASIEFEGNSDIPTEQLESNLKLIGLSEGKVFNRSLLDKVKTELQRQYLALGKYNAQVRTEVKRQERNRVAIRIEVAEGEVAAIHHLNVIGNEVYSEQELRRRFILDSNGGWFGGDDQFLPE